LRTFPGVPCKPICPLPLKSMMPACTLRLRLVSGHIKSDLLIRTRRASRDITPRKRRSSLRVPAARPTTSKSSRTRRLPPHPFRIHFWKRCAEAAQNITVTSSTRGWFEIFRPICPPDLRR
jgi:hypothetical protein